MLHNYPLKHTLATVQTSRLLTTHIHTRYLYPSASTITRHSGFENIHYEYELTINSVPDTEKVRERETFWQDGMGARTPNKTDWEGKEESRSEKTGTEGETLLCLISPSLSQLRDESVWGKGNDFHFHTWMHTCTNTFTLLSKWGHTTDFYCFNIKSFLITIG